MARGEGTEVLGAVSVRGGSVTIAGDRLELPEIPGQLTLDGIAAQPTLRELLESDTAMAFSGQVLVLEDGTRLTLEEGSPLLAAGIDRLEDFRHADGLTHAEFSDGNSCVIDPEAGTAACTCGSEAGCSHRLAALYAAAAGEDDDLRHGLRLFMETRSPELLQRLAADDAAIEDISDLTPTLLAEDADRDDTEAESLARQKLLQGQLIEAQGGLAEVMRAVDENGDPIDDDVFSRMCSEELMASRRETAERLALEIPEESTDYVLDDRLVATASIVRDAMEIGQRSFGFFGPQGTGKNTFTNQLAATLGMPVLEIDFGAGDDMEQLLGTTGLRKVDVTENVFDDKGKPVLGEDGEPLTRIVGTATETALEIGPVTQAACAKGGAVIVFNEIVEAPRGQLTTLHNMIGSEAGGGKRFIVLKSPSGEKVRYDLDPDTLIVCTWNPDRADRRPHPALASRMRMVRFAHGTLEDEVERIAVNVHSLLKDKNPDWNYDPNLTKKNADGEEIPVPLTEQIPALREEVEKDVKLMRTLREHYYDGTIEHCPDTRTAVNFSCTRLQEKDHPDGSTLALMQLEFMFNQSESAEETWQRLLEIASDTHEDVAVMSSGI